VPQKASRFSIALRTIVYYDGIVKTLVLRIPDELAAELEATAERLNVTKSEVARQRLAACSSADSPGSGFLLIADLVGTVEDGPADRSSRKKHYLRATGYGRRKRRG
jgi:hypothetical protein